MSDSVFTPSAPDVFASPVTTKPPIRPGARLTVADLSDRAKIVVKGDGAKSLGVRYGTSRAEGSRLVSGTRPDEVTILGPLEDATAIIEGCPTDGFTSVIDWTHRSVVLRLAGVDAAAAINKLCSLDLSDAMFPNGACASSQLAGITADLVRDDQDGVTSYLITADRSFGQYLFDTVLDAGDEFGISYTK